MIESIRLEMVRFEARHGSRPRFIFVSTEALEEIKKEAHSMFFLLPHTPESSTLLFATPVYEVKGDHFNRLHRFIIA